MKAVSALAICRLPMCPLGILGGLPEDKEPVLPERLPRREMIRRRVTVLLVGDLLLCRDVELVQQQGRVLLFPVSTGLTAG